MEFSYPSGWSGILEPRNLNRDNLSREIGRRETSGGNLGSFFSQGSGSVFEQFRSLSCSVPSRETSEETSEAVLPRGRG